MRILALIVALLFLLVGGVWIGQGLNLIPGSFMTGDPKWAVIGAGLVIVALALLWWARRRR